ncbi:FAD-binding oxidoreductase [Streptomyces aureus]
MFSLSLASADGAALPPDLPGQFLTVKVRAEGDALPLIRSYSLSGEPGTGTYRIDVKVEPHGAAGNHLRTHLRVGDVLDVAAPRGTSCLSDGGAPVVLLSAGVGVTPVLAMLHSLVRSRSGRQVWWLHPARNGAEYLFAIGLRELLAGLGNAGSIVYYGPGLRRQCGRSHVRVRPGTPPTDAGAVSATARVHWDNHSTSSPRELEGGDNPLAVANRIAEDALAAARRRACASSRVRPTGVRMPRVGVDDRADTESVIIQVSKPSDQEGSRVRCLIFPDPCRVGQVGSAQPGRRG